MKLEILEIFDSAAQEHNHESPASIHTTRQIEKLNHEEQPSTNEVCDPAEHKLEKLKLQHARQSAPTRKTQQLELMIEPT
jgi:hypothetical protein